MDWWPKGSFSTILFSDITFKLDGMSVYAHRAILNSRCEFMSVMLNSDFLEGKSSEVHYNCIHVHVQAHMNACVYVCTCSLVSMLVCGRGHIRFCTFYVCVCSMVTILYYIYIC